MTVPHFLQDLPRPADDDLTRLRGLQRLAAVKDLHPQLVFQLLHHHAQRRLRDVAVLRGFHVVTVNVEGHNIFQLLKVHSSEEMSKNSFPFSSDTTAAFLNFGKACPTDKIPFVISG